MKLAQVLAKNKIEVEYLGLIDPVATNYVGYSNSIPNSVKNVFLVYKGDYNDEDKARLSPSATSKCPILNAPPAAVRQVWRYAFEPEEVTGLKKRQGVIVVKKSGESHMDHSAGWVADLVTDATNKGIPLKH
jgi:hypothetical protein